MVDRDAKQDGKKWAAALASLTPGCSENQLNCRWRGLCVGAWGGGWKARRMIEASSPSSTSVLPRQKWQNAAQSFVRSLQTGSPETDYAARQTAYRAGIRGNPLILFPPEAHPALEPLRSLHDTPLRASLVAAKPPLWVPLPQHRSVRRLRLTFTRVERGCVMTTRHSRLSYTTLQFLYLLMHSTSLGNIHTVAVFFFFIHWIQILF